MRSSRGCSPCRQVISAEHVASFQDNRMCARPGRRAMSEPGGAAGPLGATSKAVGEEGPEESSCPLCNRLTRGEEFVGNALAAAMWDSFPVNPGHVLVIPRRHLAGYFALTQEEKEAIWHLVDAVGERINQDFRPQGFNIGINVGVAAGQTIFHVHMHVIPRYTGDVADPRGGVRWVIRARAPYWKDIE